MIIHNELLQKGYRLKTFAVDKHLYTNLAYITSKLAMQNYRDCRIVPGDIAVQGSNYEFEEPVHLVYIRPKTDEKETQQMRLVPLKEKSTQKKTLVNLCRELEP